MPAVLRKSFPWFLWLFLSAAAFVYFYKAMNSEASPEVFVSGTSTDGHYQIEMACTACHDNEKKDGLFTSEGVSNKACNACHGEDLEAASDSHPTRKFKNPENAVFLEHVDAMKCTACHGEHDLERTREMGVTLPENFCAHCHEVTLENRESHKDLAFNTCATSGCHNYHDNVALSPSFMVKRYAQPDHIIGGAVPLPDALGKWLEDGNEKRLPLNVSDAVAPPAQLEKQEVLSDWHGSAHAQAGVNCMDCHGSEQGSPGWVAQPDHTSCQTCHEQEVSTFLKGKHGMRLAHPELGPMTVAEARLPMHANAAHNSLSCSSCHSSHNYDRVYASHQACMKCHDGEHTRNYEKSRHFSLWTAEVAGAAPPGSGVSCATCHLPREEHDGHVLVNHNQNANLTPNEKMLQGTCMECHGMEFGLSALADHDLITANFSHPPAQRHSGMKWAASAAIEDGDEAVIILQNYLDSIGGTAPSHGPRTPPLATNPAEASAEAPDKEDNY